jgi:hypothetical protein
VLGKLNCLSFRSDRLPAISRSSATAAPVSASVSSRH